MSDYAVKITIRNGRILRRMREAGIPSVAELARRAGISISAAHQIIGLKLKPEGRDGLWRDPVERIAGVLQCDPDDLFTDAQRTMELETNTREVEMDEPSVMALASGDAEGQTWARIETQRLLECLNPRERRIIEARFSGADLQELGDEEHRTRETIRQIEAKAIRKMKSYAHRHGGVGQWGGA